MKPATEETEEISPLKSFHLAQELPDATELESVPESLRLLLKQLEADMSSKGILKVYNAYRLAELLHRPQKRSSGEPYILHPIEVALILADYRLDIPTICASLLHDTVEDTELTFDQLEEYFGIEVRKLVDGVTKLTSLSSRQGESVQKGVAFKSMLKAENLRKIFLAMAKDLRVILIKLADRLHNLRTLGGLRPEKQKRIAGESIEIFAPIASRLGVFQMKRELEDLCFQYLQPKAYKKLLEESNRMSEIREKAIAKAVEIIQERLSRLNVEAELEWREKHLYSTYKKMQRSGHSIDEIYDLVALRVIVPNVEDCYGVLGAVHSEWVPMKDRIKDYIAVPKSNNYRSLHTTVYGPNRQPLEIQIRTQEMHQVNEYGIAAHWAYKEGGKDSSGKEAKFFKEVYPWIRSILDWQDNSKDAKEYIDNLRIDLLSNEVFVFTPNGDVIDLPAGSCPIDFAYRIHTQVGHTCVGAKANGKMIPLTYELQNADVLEVLTNKSSHPSLDWLRICKSNGARNKIRNWFKRERREENVSRGREMLRREIGRQRFQQLPNDSELLEKVALELNFQQTEDLMASLGYGETTLSQVISRLRDALPKEEKQIFLPSAKRGNRKGKSKQLVQVRGLDNVLVKLAGCCSPVPGDPIVGYITLGKGVSVHVKGCHNYFSMLEQAPEREIEVNWFAQEETDKSFQVEVLVEAWDRAGLLSDVMGVVQQSKLPASSCQANTRKDKAHIRIGISVARRDQLEELMRHLRKIRDVLLVDRVHRS